MRWWRRWANEMVRLLHHIIHTTDHNTSQLEKLMVTTKELIDAVNAERATEDKLVALATAQQQQLKDLAAQLQAAIDANNPQELQATLDALNTNRQTMDDFLASVQGGGGNASVAGGGGSRRP